MENAQTRSLQETYAPKSICFGCGPANEKGLQIRSFVDGSLTRAEWTPQDHHEAFPGVLNGGIIGSLLDCHCNWTAAYFLMQKQGREDEAPCTVTAEYKVQLKRPASSRSKLELKAWVDEVQEDRAWVQGELYSDGKLCALCHGLFVAVGPDHPAYHRWEKN